MAILSRGYSYVVDGDGKIVKSINQVNVNEEISINVQDGTLNAKVISKEGKK